MFAQKYPLLSLCESILARQQLFRMEKETQGRVGRVRFDSLGLEMGFGFGVVCGKHQLFPTFFWKTLWGGDVTLGCSRGQEFIIFLSKLLWVCSLGKKSVGRPSISLWVLFFRVCPFTHPQDMLGQAVGEKFMLARSSTKMTQPNNPFFPFLCLCTGTPSLCARRVFPHQFGTGADWCDPLNASDWRAQAVV